jgi:hypothetical protein
MNRDAWLIKYWMTPEQPRHRPPEIPAETQGKDAGVGDAASGTSQEETPAVNQ